jgi:hypothetical protein
MASSCEMNTDTSLAQSIGEPVEVIDCVLENDRKTDEAGLVAEYRLKDPVIFPGVKWLDPRDKPGFSQDCHHGANA